MCSDNRSPGLHLTFTRCSLPKPHSHAHRTKRSKPFLSGLCSFPLLNPILCSSRRLQMKGCRCPQTEFASGKGTCMLVQPCYGLAPTLSGLYLGALMIRMSCQYIGCTQHCTKIRNAHLRVAGSQLKRLSTAMRETRHTSSPSLERQLSAQLSRSTRSGSGTRAPCVNRPCVGRRWKITWSSSR